MEIILSCTILNFGCGGISRRWVETYGKIFLACCLRPDMFPVGDGGTGTGISVVETRHVGWL